MHIALYGATGRVGSRLLSELLSRGHRVTAIVRDPLKLTPRAGLSVVEGALDSAEAIVPNIAGAEAVISAYAPPDEDCEQFASVIGRLIAAVKQAGVPRFLFVGGSGSLEISPGMTLIDSGYLPAEYMPIALAHAHGLEVARKSDINWTCLSPAAFFAPGERTGKFRLGTDNLISDPDQQSHISMEDYAIALVDELEHPKHERARFSIGY